MHMATRHQRAPLQALAARQVAWACPVRPCSRNVARVRTTLRRTSTRAASCTRSDWPCYRDSCATCPDCGRSEACAPSLSCRWDPGHMFDIYIKYHNDLLCNASLPLIQCPSCTILLQCILELVSLQQVTHLPCV